MNSEDLTSLRAIVRVPLTPVRAEPANQAERISEELMGSVLGVIERHAGWLYCRGEDGYAGWVNEGSVVQRSADDAEAWWDGPNEKPAIVLDAVISDERGGPLVRLPWGARVAVSGRTARLPDGRRGWLTQGEWLAWDEAGVRCPQSGASVVRTAAEWTGVPYDWGGRTRWGCDCSGFVQAVYRLHGFVLPRDSYQQFEIGEPIDPGAGYHGLEPGDLVFFCSAGSVRIDHVALALGGSAILHAMESNGHVTGDDLTDEVGPGRRLAEGLVGARRLFWME